MASSSWSAGTTRLTRPQSAAVRASIGSPVNAISRARLRPDVAGHGDERRVAEQAALAARDGEGGVLRRHRQVARRHQLAPGRGGQGVHLGAHRLGDVLQGVHHLGAHLEQVAGVVQRRALHVAEVVPGREHRAVGRQDHAEGVAGADLAQGGGELEHHVEGEGVALLGPVEGDRGDRSLVLDEQVLVRHGPSSRPRSRTSGRRRPRTRSPPPAARWASAASPPGRRRRRRRGW